MEACIVICRATKPKERKGRILFINAINEVTRERAQSFLTDDHIEHIVRTYANFRGEPGYARVATLDQVLARDGNLSIPLYVETSTMNGTNEVKQNDSLASTLSEWLKSRDEATEALMKVLPELAAAKTEARVCSTRRSGLFKGKAEWTRVRFGEVVENVNDTESDPAERGLDRFIGLEHLEPGSLHIRNWGNVADGTTFTRRCRPGQVLFGKRRAYQRKVALAEFDAVVSGDIYVLAPKGNRLVSELLPFVCLSERFFQHAVGTSAGSLSPRTNWSSLATFEFDLPPVDQQRRIAETLWGVDEHIVKGQGLEESLRRLHKAQLDSWCSRDDEGRQLGQVIKYASDGPFGSKLKTEHYDATGARVIRLQNIGEGYFNDSDKAFVSMDYFQELRRYEVRAGDVIVAGLGDETHPVGRAALIPATLGPAVNKADCFCIRANEETVLNAYLVYFLNSKRGSEQVLARAQGTTRLRINVGNIKTVIVPVRPIEEQLKLIKGLGLVELSIERVGNWLSNSSATLSGILKSLFQDQT